MSLIKNIIVSLTLLPFAVITLGILFLSFGGN